jgi:hypothetical protein
MGNRIPDEEQFDQPDRELRSEEQARRDFLRKAGRFAVVTPPAITLLLGTSLGSEAIAASSGTGPGRGPKPGWGWGDKNHDHGGPPGHKRRHFDFRPRR